jgi:hypothetical protein
MNHLAKKILGTGLALALAAWSLAAQNAAQFGNLPLWFEAGQPAKFTAHASDSEFTIAATGAEFTLSKNNGETADCQLQFVGANPAARISGDRQLTGKINYFIGNDPNQWQANVPTFAQVRVENIYPGVNVLYYGNRQKLEYDLNLAAGVNPSAIALRFDGAEKISVNSQGELVINFISGEVVQHPPVAYQTVNGTRQEIAASYKILDAHTAAFALGNYNHDEPLVIDPVLSYSTFFGGNYGETGWAIAVNPMDGSIYVAGQTFSTKNSNNIPTLTFSSSGAYQTNYRGGRQAGDAFVARFDNSGTNLIYATYLGGSADDAAYAISVDDAGDAFVAGATISTNFPTTNSIPDGNKINGILDKHVKAYPTDAFVTEIDPSGSNLLYSTYLGGNSSDAAYGITLDPDDNAYVTGFTYSTNFPVTPNAFQPHLMCTNTFYINANAFVSEISAGGMTLNYSTYLGGTNYDVGRAIAYNNGNLFVAGYTRSTNFPVTNYIPPLTLIETNTFTNTVKHVLTTNTVIVTNFFSGQHLNGSTNKNNYASDAFVTAFTMTSPTNLSLIYSTLLGGTNNDQATGIAADANGSAYVVGWTVSTNFPYTNALSGFISNSLSYVHTNGTGYVVATNGFLTRIDWNGTNANIGYSVMFGGYGVDVANGVAVDSTGNAYVVGSASSTNFPVTITTNDVYDGLSATNHYYRKRISSDVFVIAFNTNASAALYSAYIGGDGNDYGNAIAVYTTNNISNAYIAGQTLSTNFPTFNAWQSHRNGTNDMFIADIQFSLANPALVIAPGNLIPAIQSKIGGLPASEQPAVSLKWPVSTENYDVESSTDLTTWSTIPASVANSNGWSQVTLPATNGVQYFRLHKH